MSDRDLERLQSGDLDSFGNLYETHAEKIYRFLYFKTFDQSIAEDLTQETFLKALKNRSGFSGTTQKEFSAWLFTIAYNVTIDHYRTSRESDPILDNEDFGFKEDHHGHIDNTSKIEEVLKFLHTLDIEQRNIVVMRIWDDLSYKEIAEITGKTVDNCKKIVSRTLVQIQSNVTFLFAFLLIAHYFHN